MPQVGGFGNCAQLGVTQTFAIAAAASTAISTLVTFDFPHGGGNALNLYASFSESGASLANIGITPLGGFSQGETAFALPGAFTMASAASGTGRYTGTDAAWIMYPNFWAVSIGVSATAAATMTVTVFVGALAKA